MEDNNGINEQSTTINENVDYQQIIAENTQLKQVIENLYGRTKQLENTWMLNRAGFLFEILKSDVFSDDIKTKASNELTAFLFPEPQTEETNA